MDNARDRQIHVFYRPEQVRAAESGRIFSRSPLKPRLLLEFLTRYGIDSHFVRHDGWLPFGREDFLLAHTVEYVDAFFAGRQPLCESNELEWSVQFADSVRYTNASLYSAIEHAVTHPEQVRFSPTSGFHHACPDSGFGFCTFSGQVVAAVKLFRERGVAGAHIDLDGHFGNSIEDSRDFAPDLNEAIPCGCNINPKGKHCIYLQSLEEHLTDLEGRLVRNEVQYVVFAHGADSHEDDDLGGQCTTAEWLEASRIVYEMIHRVGGQLSRPVPPTLALFGGYRRDHYEAVLRLHAADLVECLKIVCNNISLELATRATQPGLKASLPDDSLIIEMQNHEHN
jgi:acetoin utilization deacetylase AcuC-like enzyme